MSMKTVLSLDRMTKTEKLQAMEELWRDLSKQEDAFEFPSWHGEVLRDREEKLSQGKDEFIPWEQAKEELRNRRN